MALSLIALRRRNQVVQGSTSVVGKLGEKPSRIALAELHLVQGELAGSFRQNKLTLWLLPLSIHAS